MILQTTLPRYAQDMLWLTDNKTLAIPVAPLIELDASSSPPLTLRWGSKKGAPLVHWDESAEILAWDGVLTVRGHVEAAHILDEIIVLELRGAILPNTSPQLPSLDDLRDDTFHREPTFYTPTDKSAWYGMVVPLESPLVDFAQQALVGSQLVDCTASFAPDKTGLHHVVGMPLLLDSLTLYG